MASSEVASTEESQLEFVQDPKRDIALHVSLEKCTVNIPHRQKLQEIWVQHGGNKGKLTTKQYDEKVDAPTGWHPKTTFSQKATTPSDERVRMMVVGLFLLDNPYKYSTVGNKGAKENAQTKEERRKRGPWIRKDRMGFVVSKSTPFLEIGSTVRYYALLEPVHDISGVRVLRQDAIFFFEEFWPKDVNNILARDRGSRFSEVVRRAVALKKHGETSSKVLTGDPTDPEWMAARGPKNTDLQNNVNKLVLLADMWNTQRNPETLEAFHQCLQLMQRIQNDQNTGSDGVLAFFNEDAEFTHQICNSMITELTSTYNDHGDFLTLNSDVVQAIRKNLFSLKLQASVPPRRLVTLLSIVHRNIALEGASEDSIGIQKVNMSKIVQSAVISIQEIERYPVRTASTSTSAVTTSDFVGTLTKVRDLLQASDDSVRADCEWICKQHGGIPKVKRVGDLLNAAARLVDRVSFGSNNQQIFALHAEQFVCANLAGVQRNEWVIDMLDKMIGHYSA